MLKFGPLVRRRFQFFVNPLVRGEGERVFGGRGPVRMELADVTRYDSGVTLLSYGPAA